MGRTPNRLPRYPIGTKGVTDVINLEDSEKINFGDDKDYYIYFDGTDFLIDSGTHSLEIDLKTAGVTSIYLGDTSGDDGYIYANSVNTYPHIFFEGNSGVAIKLNTGASFLLYNAASDFFKVRIDDFTYETTNATGTAAKFKWESAVTSTGNMVGLEVDASSNLTMGTNLGVTGLKIVTIAANGSGESFGIDASGVPSTEVLLKYTATGDTVTATVGTDAPNNWIKAMIGTTAYYIPAWTVDGA